MWKSTNASSSDWKMYAIEKPEIDKSQFETIIEEINEENIPPNAKVLRSSLNREAPKYNSTKAEEQVDALRKPLGLFSPVRAAMGRGQNK